MERVVGQKGDRPAFGRLHRHDRDVGIDRPGRLDQVGAAGGRIHLDPVGGPAERVGGDRARLHPPAPVEDLPSFLPTPQPIRAGRRLFEACCTASAIRSARNLR